MCFLSSVPLSRQTGETGFNLFGSCVIFLFYFILLIILNVKSVFYQWGEV